MESQSPSPASPEPAGRRGDRTLPLVLLAASSAAAVWLATMRPPAPPAGPHDGASRAAPNWVPAPAPTGETVSLVIDFGNGARREWTLPWRDGMTLGDAMEAAEQFRPGLSYVAEGAGEMSLLTSLEGVANEGGDGRYWLYSVDGRHGEVSYAVQPLAAGQQVLWQFRRGEYN